MNEREIPPRPWCRATLAAPPYTRAGERNLAGRFADEHPRMSYEECAGDRATHHIATSVRATLVAM